MAERATIVTGSKGGVGTSTVALNLAVQLALQTKKRVALIDLARPFGQISLMLDFEPRFTILDALERIERIDESILTSMATRHKSGVEILAGPLQAPMKPEQRLSVTIQSISRLIQIAGQAYDFVIADIGVVNAGDWALVLQEAQTILLVSEPSALALGMIDRHMAAAARAGIEWGRIHIVINRWRQNDDDPVAAFEKSSGRAILTRLPNDYRQLTEAVQLAMPLMGSGNNPLIARYRDLAARLALNLKDAPSPETTIARISC
jgi:pilus assembly protein CpaE